MRTASPPQSRLMRWLNAWIIKALRRRLAAGSIKSPADRQAALNLLDLLETHGIRPPTERRE
jgi:hypothetical protein